MKTLNTIALTIFFCIIISAGIFKQVIKSNLSHVTNELNKKDSLLTRKQEQLNLSIEISFKLDSICELNPTLKKLKQTDKELIKLNDKLWQVEITNQ